MHDILLLYHILHIYCAYNLWRSVYMHNDFLSVHVRVHDIVHLFLCSRESQSDFCTHVCPSL